MHIHHFAEVAEEPALDALMRRYVAGEISGEEYEEGVAARGDQRRSEHDTQSNTRPDRRGPGMWHPKAQRFSRRSALAGASARRSD
jgi:hypothetical protein